MVVSRKAPQLEPLTTHESFLSTTDAALRTSKFAAQQRLQVFRLRRTKASLAQQGLLEGQTQMLNDADKKPQDLLLPGGGNGGEDMV
jgi:hypothetical protein